ncbi:MAG TPA: EamA family transporter, partial [Mycobacteriales bacterium]|nr:EamA family transporter [Mycobacteriales bacterium]
LLCLLWGSSFVAAKAGVDEVPALLFTAVRSLVAGLPVLVYPGPKAVARFIRSTGGITTAGLALLINACTYGGLYWGTGHIASGLVGVINGSLMPSTLFAFGLLSRDETFRWNRLAGLLAGGLGLVILTWPAGSAHNSVAGVVAVAGGTLAYTAGTVLSRRLAAPAVPIVPAGTYMLGGGVILAAAGPFLEPWHARDLHHLLGPSVAVAVLYLSLITGIGGFAIYLTLVRDLGPARAGTYAYVTPIIALILGAAFYGEPFTAREMIGAAVMIGSSVLVLQQPCRGPGLRIDQPAGGPNQRER